MKRFSLILLLFLFTLTVSVLISCNKNSTTSIDEEPNDSKGKIIVFVIDNDPEHTPVPNVEIFISPVNQSKFTDSSGTCIFELNPDIYVVDAYLCCAGPGYIEYHDSVVVAENVTKYLTFTACLGCL